MAFNVVAIEASTSSYSFVRRWFFFMPKIERNPDDCWLQHVLIRVLPPAQMQPCSSSHKMENESRRLFLVRRL